MTIQFIKSTQSTQRCVIPQTVFFLQKEKMGSEKRLAWGNRHSMYLVRRLHSAHFLSRRNWVFWYNHSLRSILYQHFFFLQRDREKKRLSKRSSKCFSSLAPESCYARWILLHGPYLSGPFRLLVALAVSMIRLKVCPFFKKTQIMIHFQEHPEATHCLTIQAQYINIKYINNR